MRPHPLSAPPSIFLDMPLISQFLSAFLIVMYVISALRIWASVYEHVYGPLLTA